MIKWQSAHNKIKPIEVLRETKHAVYVKAGMEPKGESRMLKRTTWANIHDSWEEAKQYLLGEQEARVLGLRLSLERANSVLGNIKGMKAPTE